MVVKEPNHLVSVHELAVFEPLVSVEFLDQRRQLVSRQSLSFKRRPARARLCIQTVRQEAAYPPFPLLGFVRLVSVGGARSARKVRRRPYQEGVRGVAMEPGRRALVTIEWRASRTVVVAFCNAIISVCICVRYLGEKLSYRHSCPKLLAWHELLCT
jgi:hypothetical protein